MPVMCLSDIVVVEVLYDTFSLKKSSWYQRAGDSLKHYGRIVVTCRADSHGEFQMSH